MLPSSSTFVVVRLPWPSVERQTRQILWQKVRQENDVGLDGKKLFSDENQLFSSSPFHSHPLCKDNAESVKKQWNYFFGFRICKMYFLRQFWVQIVLYGKVKLYWCAAMLNVAKDVRVRGKLNVGAFSKRLDLWPNFLWNFQFSH